MTAFMVVAGIILLLPGVCALLFGGGTLLSEGRVDPGIVSYVVLGLLVGHSVSCWSWRRFGGGGREQRLPAPPMTVLQSE
jgi:hypothetical protein